MDKSDTLVLSSRGEVGTTETIFGTRAVTVDNNGGLYQNKDGTGLAPNDSKMDNFEDNIRLRFSLDNDNDDSPKGDSDADDY